ncbi:MAG: 2-hydroxyacyl-CoA dehydratase [Oscillospiraceae bacterium]|jgi:predicted nucleotide-binding protein (sugar kinase/HSP70/actin superfamily)|nr:2-hydroxyacyl-CoA dehydratase [Oscillospiraceae bacterium]
MAELKYDESGRLLFTKEMKKEYTLLIPQMLPITFTFLKKVFELYGYKCEMLTTTHRGIVDTGLKYVHNDTCYPALLVIGQLIEAVNSGQYDTSKLALLISQTGGGCRASNYIHLLRKALEKAGLAHIPVVSINLSGLEKNPGFSLTIPIIRRLVMAMIYGDFLMWLANQTRPYEVTSGTTELLIAHWTDEIVALFGDGKGMTRKEMRSILLRIAADFAGVERAGAPKPRVGVVGEIYVKFAPLGNNNLEAFLLAEGCEPVVPGLTDFMIFKINNRSVDVDLYHGNKLKKLVADVFQKYIEGMQRVMIEAVKSQPCFRPMGSFADLQRLIKGYLGYGNKMGEGWLLTAEMLELIHSGTSNIVCTQPFGCLPNHVVGKGMIRRLKDDYPDSNIVAVDYDPGATRINQENRIKLMISNAGRHAEAPEHASSEQPIAAAK